MPEIKMTMREADLIRLALRRHWEAEGRPDDEILFPLLSIFNGISDEESQRFKRLRERQARENA